MDEVEEQISLTLMLLNKASSDLRGHFTNSNKQFHKSIYNEIKYYLNQITYVKVKGGLHVCELKKDIHDTSGLVKMDELVRKEICRTKKDTIFYILIGSVEVEIGKEKNQMQHFRISEWSSFLVEKGAYYRITNPGFYKTVLYYIKS